MKKRKLYILLLSLFLLLGLKGIGRDKGLCIALDLPDCRPGDTAVLIVHHYLIPGISDSSSAYKATCDKRGRFSFAVDSFVKAHYISTARSEVLNGTTVDVTVLEHYYAEPGDDVRIKASPKGPTGPVEKSARAELKYKLNYNFSFSGHGAEKYAARYQLDKDLNDVSDDNLLDAQKRLTKSGKVRVGRTILDSYRSKISREAYSVLLVDLTAEAEIERLRPLMASQNFQMDELISLYADLPAEAFSISRYYPQYLSATYRAVFKSDRHSPGWGAFRNIVDDFEPSILRDRLLTVYILTVHRRLLPEVITEAVGAISSPYYRKQLLQLKNSLMPGSPAFDFKLPDAAGNYVQLSHFKGKVVFIDFWFTGCHACKGYYKEVLKDVKQHFKDNPNVVFLTISVDKDAEKWRTSIQSGDYTSPTSVNLYTGGKGTHDVTIENYKVLSYPRPLLINRDGKIVTAQDTELRLGGTEPVISAIKNALTKPL